MKCKLVLTNNKCSIEKTFKKATFQNPRVNCTKIKDSFGVSWLPISLVIKLRSLLEDSEICVSRNTIFVVQFQK